MKKSKEIIRENVDIVYSDWLQQLVDYYGNGLELDDVEEEDYCCDNLFGLYENLQDEIEIDLLYNKIKNISCDIDCISISDNLEEYNRLVDDECKLSQEDYDLVKKWLG